MRENVIYLTRVILGATRNELPDYGGLNTAHSKILILVLLPPSSESGTLDTSKPQAPPFLPGRRHRKGPLRRSKPYRRRHGDHSSVAGGRNAGGTERTILELLPRDEASAWHNHKLIVDLAQELMNLTPVLQGGRDVR